MSERNELVFSEGLFYDEFIIKGDGDYLLLCNDLMEKFKIMENRVQYLENINQKYALELRKIRNNKKSKVSNPQALLVEYNEKIKQVNSSWKKIVESNIKLERKRKKLVEYYHYLKNKEKNKINISTLYIYDSKLNKLQQENKSLRYKNRMLRIKNINLLRKHNKLLLI